MSGEMWLEADLKDFRHPKIYFRAIESQFGVQNGHFPRAMNELNELKMSILAKNGLSKLFGPKAIFVGLRF